MIVLGSAVESDFGDEAARLHADLYRWPERRARSAVTRPAPGATAAGSAGRVALRAPARRTDRMIAPGGDRCGSVRQAGLRPHVEISTGLPTRVAASS